MEDGAAVASTSSDTTSEKMVATNTNNNAARKAILEDRKRQIEEKLSKCNQELRQLCIQEAELTGITPPEMPLEAGETPPTIRRKVGTAFQLNENLINNSNKDQLIADLELQIQLHKNLRDAALGLANEGSISKTVKRQHRAEYQKHKEQVKALEEKLALLKEKAASEQIKHKKKSRVPEPQEDNVSVITNDPYLKQENRHSQISNKHSSSMLSPTDTYPENRYPPSTSRQSQYNRTSENLQFHYQKPEDVLASGFYRLSLNGYNEYIERQEGVTSIPPYGYQPHNPYNYPPAVHSQSLHMSQIYSQQHSPSSISQSSPQMSQHSPHLTQSNHYLPHQNSHYSQHSPMMSQHSPLSQHSPVSQHSPQMQRDSPQLSHSPLSQHSLAMHRASQNYSRMSQQYAQLRQSSPTMSNSAKVQYYPSHTFHGEPGYNRYTADTSGYRNTLDASFFRNAHPIQPHQQYENNGMNTGLGGCWKRSESGEMFWVYTSSTLDSSWQRDKRFGSLDRRKNKRVQRRISPVDSKSATLATMPAHGDQVKTAFVKPSQVANRRSQDHRQLVRTQSLGSVGQTIDSVYPSDDTSSCESDNRSFKENRATRKPKEKEWMETSLDGPISPTHSVISRSQSTVPPTLTPEEKYVVHIPPPPPPPQMSPTLPPYMSPNSHPMPGQPIPHHIQNIPPPPPVQSPLSPKPPLEIPAESNPSPRVPEPPNIELLNNNIPKNCTIVQAGVVKPYHEETKPFEMSDFYKYSTKFKKSPQKEPGNGPARSQSPGGTMGQKNLNDNFEAVGNRYPVMVQKQYVQHSSTRESTNTANMNNSLDLSPLSVSERFSEEMNAWYQDQEHHNDNNNARGSKTRSSATLV